MEFTLWKFKNRKIIIFPLLLHMIGYDIFKKYQTSYQMCYELCFMLEINLDVSF